MNERIQAIMYQYSRAIYRSIKDLIDPYVDTETQLEYRRAVLAACEETVERLATRSALLRTSRARALRRHPPLLPDHRAGAGLLGGEPGHRRRGDVRRGADRGRRVRRRRRTLPGDDAQGQAVPAHAAPRARVLPVAPASRDRPHGRLEPRRRVAAPILRRLIATLRQPGSQFPRRGAARPSQVGLNTGRCPTMLTS